MAYKILVDVLDHIDKEAGTYDNGQPKVVNQHHKGDVVDLSDIDEQRIQELVDAGAIEEDKGDDEDEESETPADAPTAPAASTSTGTSTPASTEKPSS